MPRSQSPLARSVRWVYRLVGSTTMMRRRRRRNKPSTSPRVPSRRQAIHAMHAGLATLRIGQTAQSFEERAWHLASHRCGSSHTS